MKTIMYVMLALCMTACSSSDDFKTAESTPYVASVATEFDFDARDFAEAFNRAARKQNQGYHIDQVEIQQGVMHDYFRQMLDANISLSASLSRETGRITTVTLLFKEQADAHDRAKLLPLAKLIMLAVNPRLSLQQAETVANAMLDEMTMTTDARHFPQRFIDHVRYAVRSDSAVGYWWTANPA